MAGTRALRPATAARARTRRAVSGSWRTAQLSAVKTFPDNGGIIITDEQFGDFEVALEMNNDFGPDSGLFLRSTEDGTAFQAMIDYHGGRESDGRCTGKGTRSQAQRDELSIPRTKSPTSSRSRRRLPLPVLPQSWPSFWRHGQWNELRARIVGNPPAITTWINGVKFMEWTETEKRHPDAGGIALQVHGGGDHTKEFVRYRNIRVKKIAPNNALTEQEQKEGWVLLFGGSTFNGWMNSDRSAPRSLVESGALNPHKAGHYMLVHTQQWADFVLSLDFKISKGCNSGIFVRTSSLTPRPGKDVGFNGIEIAIDDTTGAGFHDTGAIYDLVKPSRNAMKPVGEWNHIEITCDKSLIEVALNDEIVTRADLDKFTQANKRPGRQRTQI